MFSSYFGVWNCKDCEFNKNDSSNDYFPNKLNIFDDNFNNYISLISINNRRFHLHKIIQQKVEEMKNAEYTYLGKLNWNVMFKINFTTINKLINIIYKLKIYIYFI